MFDSRCVECGFWIQLAKCVEIGLPEIIILVVFSQVVNKFITFLTIISFLLIAALYTFFNIPFFTNLTCVFAVHSSYDERRETYLWSLCSNILSGNCVDLCSSTYSRWSIQKFSSQNSNYLQNWSCRNYRGCPLVSIFWFFQ